MGRRQLGAACLAVSMVLLAGCSGTSAPRPRTGLADLPKPTFPGLVLGVDKTNRLVIKDFGDPTQDRLVSSRLGFPDLPVIAGAAAAGWVTTVGHTAGPETAGRVRVATVGDDGVAHPFGPVIRDGAISSLAVSPDGRELAMGIEATTTAAIQILPMPGFRGRRHAWSLPADNQVRQLSWSPDGRRLSYVAGGSTGDGIGGPPAFLDTQSAGATATDASPWREPRLPACNVWRSARIDAAGQYAVLEGCSGHRNGGEFLRIVDALTGRPRAAPVKLSGASCDDADPYGSLYGATKASQLLISWCGRVYFFRHHRAYELPGNLTLAAAAWVVPGG